MAISLADYLMGRQFSHADEFSPLIERNGAETVRRANLILNEFYAVFPKAAPRRVNSGWRPPSLNAQVRNAAVKSKHMTGEAVDLSDDDEALDIWIESPQGLMALERYGVWVEARVATPRWAHLQIVAPRSGRRIFHP